MMPDSIIRVVPAGAQAAVLLAGLLHVASLDEAAAQGRVQTTYTLAADSLGVRNLMRKQGNDALDNLHYSLPHLTIYDARGRQTHDGSEIAPPFEETLEALLTRSTPTDGTPGLADEYDGFFDPVGGEPVSRLIAPGRPTIIVYWAEWCAPCKPLIEKIDHFLSTRPHLATNLFLIEADPLKYRLHDSWGH